MKPMRVSSILRVNGMVDAWWFQSEHRERGRAVHWLLEAVLRGQDVSPGDKYAGYLAGIRAGLAALPLVPVCVERRLEAHGISGRPDVVGYLDAPVGRLPAGPVVVDGKSGGPLPWHGVQLAFYEWLAQSCGLREEMPPQYRRLPWTLLGLYVDAAGGHRIKTYGGPADRDAMYSAVVVARWRVEHGLLDAAQLAVNEDEEPAEPPAMEAEA